MERFYVPNVEILRVQNANSRTMVKLVVITIKNQNMVNGLIMEIFICAPNVVARLRKMEDALI